ncbi:MAG: hypothetical protein IKM66_08240, partial [Clostridia bacterium]|nr:hypothetical protein [Clostridia bacterium]
MKKKILIIFLLPVGIIAVGLSALWQNGYLDLHTPNAYEFGEEGSCLFDGDNLYYAVSEDGEVCIEGIRRVTDT